MTVVRSYNVEIYKASGETDTFYWTGDLDEVFGKLVVSNIDDDGKNVRVFEEGRDYQVIDKKVVFSEMPPNGMKIKIERNTPRAQQTVFMEGEKFPAKEFENALDRLFMIEQEQDFKYLRDNEEINENINSAVEKEKNRAVSEENALKSCLDDKQNKLVAGENIVITGDVISAIRGATKEEVFIAKYGVTTWKEIDDAYKACKNIVLDCYGRIGVLNSVFNGIGGSNYEFYCLEGATCFTYVITTDSG